MVKKRRRTGNFHRGVSSIGNELDGLDPLHSKANTPPSEGQLEAALKIGVDLTGKNMGSAGRALSKGYRENAIAIIEENEIVPGTTCMYRKVTPVTITKVGGAQNMHIVRGAIVYIHCKGPPLINKWVHPCWLSEFKLPEKKEGDTES